MTVSRICNAYPTRWLTQVGCDLSDLPTELISQPVWVWQYLKPSGIPPEIVAFAYFPAKLEY